jgi:phosphoserine aminotransferase
VLVIVRDDLLGQAIPETPTVLDYRKMADADSMVNTPPTFSVYLAGLTFKWLLDRGGLAKGRARQRRQGEAPVRLHSTRRTSTPIPWRRKTARAMNVPFVLPRRLARRGIPR